MKTLKLIILLFMLTSCWRYNKPLSEIPNENVPPNIARIFVDKNGDFFPVNWKTLPYYPLRASSNNLGTTLIDTEESVLNKIKQISANKERIFILVHGYNNDENDAQNNYRKLQQIIQNNSTKDLFIEFHWDGLIAKNLGSTKIWFNAAGYSQMAGQFGLRKVLNQISNKQVYLISHSRGASVILSALSNPPYNEKFATETNEFYSIDVWNVEPLLENNNNITTIFLAPAVGEIDFTVPRNPNKYREFSRQIKAMHITVNNTDKTLNKYLNKPEIFNSTLLGSNKKAFSALKPHYPVLAMTDVSGLESHSFSKYLSHDGFRKMLNEYNISTNNP